MQILLANPRGFCAGVDRAIDIVERAIELFGAPIYVRHEVVHNKYVVDRLRTIGAVFVEELDEVPGRRDRHLQRTRRLARHSDGGDAPLAEGVRCHLSAGDQGAHGSHALCARGARGVSDRPCRASRGRGHDRTVRHLASAAAFIWSRRSRTSRASKVRNPEHLAFVTQTTLSVDDTASIVEALRSALSRASRRRCKEDICYATQNRQDAVKDLIGRCDVLVVVGSQSSSNSNRLREMADKAGIPGYLVDGPEHLRREWFDGANTVGVTAGASAPEILVQGVISQLREWGGEVAEELKGREEHVIFALPRTLREVAQARRQPFVG